MDEALEAVVRGRVQGVGFRYFIHREAMALGLAGWVSNEPDGTVRCLAIGDRPTLDALVERLRAGPPAAIVDRVDLTWRPAPAGRTYTSFSIQSGAHRGD
jgi:acylphosphatase